MLDHAVIKIIATEMGVTSGSQKLEDAVDREKRDIESSFTEIVDGDLRLATCLVETVRDSSGRGAVDDTENGKTSDSAGILGGLASSVVEVGGR